MTPDSLGPFWWLLALILWAVLLTPSIVALIRAWFRPSSEPDLSRLDRLDGLTDHPRR